MALKISTALHQQKLAADPSACVWVNASAGTGKTKVLTDRILALLLAGADPIKILCLTFTKAAAAEMHNRLSQRLSRWALQDDVSLTKELIAIQSQQVTPDLLIKARALFTEVLETPGGMRIQTIHGFCQTILQRFALEASVPANFKILDDQQSEELQYQALNKTLENSVELGNWLPLIQHYFKDQSFLETLQQLFNHRQRLNELQSQFPTVESFESHLKAVLNLCNTWALSKLDLAQNIIYQACSETFIKTATDSDPELLKTWVTSEPQARMRLFNDYCGLFLTKEGEISKRPKVKNEAEAERLYRLIQLLNTVEIAQKSLVVVGIGLKIFAEYQLLKTRQNYLDYDDLIDHCLKLLQQPQISPWILYKLDGGIDHILIDEAQDTSPPQWQIIRTIIEELFSNNSRQRSLFVVGDGKQSIYSFQGANPQDFINFQEFFARYLQQLGITWRQLDLEVSFRSTPAVLELVDQLFSKPERVGPSLTNGSITHIPFRSESKGHVCLLPAVTTEGEEEDSNHNGSGWKIPETRVQSPSLVRRFCDKLCQQIISLLQSNQPLPSTNAPIQPKDILILVRQRGELMNELIRTLKRYQIPTMGADRFTLTDHLIIQDLLALGQFLLLPDDDLSLACLLRSPFINLSEEELAHLAINRPASLWHSLQHHHSTSISFHQAHLILKELAAMVDYASPYALYDAVIHQFQGKARFIERFGHEAIDIINEFMRVAYDFETQKQQSLQEFISYLLHNELIIKRDSNDETSNQIRLMTIHGSKGLQAPIVILTEKFSNSEPQDKLLWHLDDNGRCDLILTRPTQRADIPLTSTIKQYWQHQETFEDQRLLYVALTRAADHLYVCGYGNKVTSNSWYQQIIDQASPTMSQWLTPTQPYTPDSTDIAQFPEWSLTKINNAPTIKSSQPIIAETTQIQKGIVIHKLFEVLGDIAPAHRTTAGQNLLSLLKLSVSDWLSELHTVIDLLNDSTLSIFYGEDSFSELEIYHPKGNIIRLDRVVITTKEIIILDYKTTKSPPLPHEPIPSVVINQLQNYCEALHHYYPDSTISCYILWTSKPSLQLVPIDILWKKNISIG